MASMNTSITLRLATFRVMFVVAVKFTVHKEDLVPDPVFV